MSRFERLGSAVYRHRRAIIATWGLILLLALPFAPRAGGALRAGGFTLDTLESARARSLLVAELHLPPSALVVVFHSDQLVAGSAPYEAAVTSAMTHVPDSAHVVSVLSHRAAPRLVSADGHTAYDIVFLDLAPDDSPLALPTVEAALGPSPGVEVALAGGPAFYGDVQTVSESDLRRSEAISLPLAGLTLIVVFGSLVAAAVPLAVGGSAVVVALAVIFGLASLTPMSIFVLNLATLLGLGLGVDYSLLLTSRFREELAKRAAWRDLPAGPARDLARTAAVETAVRITVATAGRAVFFSGLTVLLGLVGLILFQFMILRSVGMAGAVVVGLAVLAALTLLPAILGVLGPRLDALAIRRVTVTPGTEGPWARLARAVMRRPVAVLVPTLALLLVLGSPFLSVRFNAPDATILPPSVPSRASYELLAREFGEGAFAPLTLAIRTSTAATTPASLAALYDYSRRLAADPRVTRVVSLVDVDPRLTLAQYQLLYGDPAGPPDRFIQTTLASSTAGDLTAFTVYTPYGPNADAGRALVQDLRAPSGPLAAPPGMTVLVSGGAAEVQDEGHGP